MKVVIAGSRSITDYKIVSGAIELSGFDITLLISGTAKGVDKLGEQFAQNHGIPIKQFPANWTKFGKAAGFYRNWDMAEYCDAGIIIWDGRSNGTLQMINCLKKRNKPYYLQEV